MQGNWTLQNGENGKSCYVYFTTIFKSLNIYLKNSWGREKDPRWRSMLKDTGALKATHPPLRAKAGTVKQKVMQCALPSAEQASA